MIPKGDKKQAALEKPGESSKNPGPPLGEILRRAREDLGLDYAQLSEITRLRPPILESLENEEWDRLAAPVFVKGFLRSYARALKLPEQDILRLYAERGPDGPPIPKPLASLTPRRKKTPVAVFIFLILLVGIAFFSWHRYDRFHGSKEPVITGDRSKGKMAAIQYDKEPHAPLPVEKGNGRPKAGTVSGVTGVKPEERPSQAAVSRTSPLPGKEERTAIPSEKTPNDLSQKAVAQPSTREEPSKVMGATKSVSKTLSLEAEVRETTWVRIIVDDAPPKQYVFRPGSHPEWKAHEGFQIVIGNAGGIALVFNGRKLDNLGQHGKVISLKLPK
jgi:cytoskeleton protein RodZ